MFYSFSIDDCDKNKNRGWYKNQAFADDDNSNSY